MLGVDVGRKGCNTEIAVWKSTPQVQGTSIKSLVNIHSIHAEDFETQAITIKKIFMKYKCRVAAIDANGLGVGLIDFMVKSQIDPETSDELPPFGVEGGTYEGADQDYKKFKSDNMIPNALWLIKAHAAENTEAHSYMHSQMRSGRLKFLIDEQEAKTKLLSTKLGQSMTAEERNEYLMPYQNTSILKNQLLNLTEEHDGINIILKQSNTRIPKDKFSAAEYGLLYIKREETKRLKRKTMDISRMMFVN